MQELDFMKMTKEDFLNMPITQPTEDTFSSVIIIPENHLHDSGYTCMSYVLCRGKEPFMRIGGGSDVIHIDGVGGLGDWWINGGDIPEKITPKGWKIDCLPCGLIRLFANCELRVRGGFICSDFDLYAVEEKK